MNLSKSLDSVYYITLPEEFKFSSAAMQIDVTIPLPVQKKEEGDADSFDMTSLSESLQACSLFWHMTERTSTLIIIAQS